MKVSIKQLCFVTAIILILSLTLSAQTGKCGTDQSYLNALAKDPVYAASIKKQSEDWERYNNNLSQSKIVPSSNGNIYEIPVVVHVVHTGGAIGTTYNPTNQQIQNWIDNCNQVYAAQYSVFPDTLNGGVYIPIRLVLAVRDTSCNLTSGIERIDGSSLGNYATNGVKNYTGSGTGVSDTALKALSIWPHFSYFNIWLVTMIDGGGTAGFATFPQATPYLDGVMIGVIYSQPGLYSAAVLPHETGHYFGLLHTFWGDNGGTSCPVNSNCLADGDGICDTEPHIEASGCPSGINACTGVNYNNVQFNIMNYSSCVNRLTSDQKNKMLFSLLNYRYNLLTSLALTPPGNDTVLTPPQNACVPTGITNVNNNLDVGVRNVLLADMVVNTSGYTYDGNQYYVDHTLPGCIQPQPIAHLDRDSTYTLTVTSGANPENVRGWIDFNNDGTFSSSELIISSNGTSFNETHLATFTITPTVVPCTPLRMRIASDVAGPPPPQACSNPQYGQTEDFMVIINPLTPSVSIAAIPGTSVSAGITVTFIATGAYGGNNPQYQWRKNGSTLPGISTATWAAVAGVGFVSGDIITALMISSEPCVKPNSVISNSLTMKTALITAINALPDKDFILSIYPNPNNGIFVIDGILNTMGNYELIVTNIMGQKVYEETIEINSQTLHAEITLTDLPQGTYSFILRRNQETLKTLKLINIH